VSSCCRPTDKTDSCTCAATEILIFPCSGGSNVGQLANSAAVELTREGVGKLFCLAGIGGHVDSFIESTKGAKRIVAIDGCPVKCARKTLEHAGFEVSDPHVVTELGVKKTHDFDLPPADVKLVVEAVKRGLGR